jgi:hypothetical protein
MGSGSRKKTPIRAMKIYRSDRQSRKTILAFSLHLMREKSQQHDALVVLNCCNVAPWGMKRMEMVLCYTQSAVNFYCIKKGCYKLQAIENGHKFIP